MELTITLDDFDLLRDYNELGFTGQPYGVTFWVEIYYAPAEPSVGYKGEKSIQSVEKDGKKFMESDIPKGLLEALYKEMEDEIKRDRYESIIRREGL